MTYNFAVYRGPLLLQRTLTRSKAQKIAALHGGIVKAETYIAGGK